MKIEFNENKTIASKLLPALHKLRDTHVEIGLPESASSRNRFLLALHERGAPMGHIPPRPVVVPALSQAETQIAIADGLRSACEAAAEGDIEGITDGFEQAGKAGVEGIRSYIDSGIQPGNALLTIHGGWIRNFSSGKPVRVEGKGFDKPLYDTGELYNAFDYEVKS